MLASLSRSPCSNEATVSWTSEASWYASVDPHHTMTRRSQPFSALNVAMSSMIAMAWSHLLGMSFTRTPSRRDTQRWSNTASIGTTASSSLEIAFRSASLSTPAVRAASRAFGEIGSQPPKTMSSRLASGTNSRIIGLRFSSFVPRRMCAIWLIDPIGGCRPWRAAMTPAMKVEETAPMPGVRTPSLPVAGAICRAVIPQP